MNEGKFAKVMAAYKENLRKAHENDKTGKYFWPISELDKIVAKTKAIIEEKGIRAVDIKSTGWKSTAKQFGIANTYNAWEGHLG